MKQNKTPFGILPVGASAGQPVDKYTFEAANGASVSILSLGGIIQSLTVPDKNGTLADIVCGFDSLDGYLGDGYFGALIGRYGNRIGGAGFSLDGEHYSLFVNSGARDHLHGGKEGFNRKLWRCVPSVSEKEERGILRLFYTSPDGEEGYPGKLDVAVTYCFEALGGSCRLSVRYEAVTDQPTVVNLTNHSYFNLDGYDGGDVMSHRLWLDADSYTAVDEDLIPLPGAPADVAGTVFDFRSPRPIAHPFDHSFNFTRERQNGMIRRRGEVVSPASGRRLTLFTSSPAVQLYTGCVMNGKIPFKGGVPQRPLHAFCLETQFAPDTPNRPDFLPCVLRPGEKYDFTTVFAFDTVNG